MRTLDATNPGTAGEQFHGTPGAWVCIAKAWNALEQLMKSTKVLEVPGAGCFLQVTTMQGSESGEWSVSEAVTWAPDVKLNEDQSGLVAFGRPVSACGTNEPAILAAILSEAEGNAITFSSASLNECDPKRLMLEFRSDGVTVMLTKKGEQ